MRISPITKFQMQPVLLKDTTLPFQQLNISLGDTRFYADDKLQVQSRFAPEKPYSRPTVSDIGGPMFLV